MIFHQFLDATDKVEDQTTQSKNTTQLTKSMTTPNTQRENSLAMPQNTHENSLQKTIIAQDVRDNNKEEDKHNFLFNKKCLQNTIQEIVRKRFTRDMPIRYQNHQGFIRAILLRLSRTIVLYKASCIWCSIIVHIWSGRKFRSIKIVREGEENFGVC